MNLNRVTMLAAADELHAATIEAMVWVMDNHCLDVRLNNRVSLMLNSCAEVAQTARRAIVHPSGDPEAVLERLGNLLTIVDFSTAVALQVVSTDTGFSPCTGQEASSTHGWLQRDELVSAK
jgi:hypothetical protein